MQLALLLGMSAVGVVGVAIIVAAIWPGSESDPSSRRTWPGRRADPRHARLDAIRAAVGTSLFALVMVLSGWIGPALVVAAGGWWAVGAFRVQRGRDGDDIERVDALASWIENLRDVLVAGDQPVGAITRTVATCPSSIRPQVRRLAAGLGRQDPDVVFRRFADELDDPIGDLVAAGLLIAVRRGGRTVGVLSALAEQARAQSDRRRLVLAERAPARREVSVLTAIMVALVAALFVFARSDYLAAYHSPSGQIVLSVALVGFTALLVRVQRLARFPRPSRFLMTGGAI